MSKILLRYIINMLVRYLSQPVLGYQSSSQYNIDDFQETLRSGDVLLIEGNLRISLAVKYLTQSSWSHSTLFIGKEVGLTDIYGNPAELIEADISHGVIATPLNKYAGFNMRICRPVNLNSDDTKKIIRYMCSAVGIKYDFKNVIDLVRYTLPQPPVPQKWRRKLLSLGSNEPTKAICSTLIAKAFEQINYPILPEITQENKEDIFHIKHHSLYAPRDFDISPYFEIIKPNLKDKFDYKTIKWNNTQ